MSAEANLASTRFELSPDTVLLLYTDGWFDAGPVRLHRSPESLAAEVCSLLDRPLAEIVGHLRRDAVNRAGGRLEDDLVLLALRRKGSDSRRR